MTTQTIHRFLSGTRVRLSPGGDGDVGLDDGGEGGGQGDKFPDREDAVRAMADAIDEEAAQASGPKKPESRKETPKPNDDATDDDDEDDDGDDDSNDLSRRQRRHGNPGNGAFQHPPQYPQWPRHHI